ncbi:MAG: hypothetical protein JJE53_02795 [Candidatus Pacebacteria bacterium]|nr:hypothetical protein [Candidatus Paceibacterota bacterium]
MNQHEPNDWKKYIIVLFITSSIFISGLWLSNYLSNKKIDQLKSIESSISLDLMSSEVQFALLEELSCKDVSTTVLSSELNSLADKISYSENNIGIENVDVISLKKYYSLLEIKDYLLMKKITERCGQKSIFILYFYKNDNCDECTKQGYVLTDLRQNYPNLRVYSFDYNLDNSAIRAMRSIYKVPDNLPAIVINGKVYSGFKTVEEIEETFPQLESIKVEEVTKPKTSTTNTIKNIINKVDTVVN